MNGIEIKEVTLDNIGELGVFCIKDKNSTGSQAKVAWFKKKLNQGLKMKIVFSSSGKQVGFIEYIPSEMAWRPIHAENYYFIQCIALFSKDSRERGLGSHLLDLCEQEAKAQNKSGICVMSSDGPWMANKSLFEKNKFEVLEKLDRFELMAKVFDKKSKLPHFIDWNKGLAKYSGWHLLYSNQCPWHDKAITDLKELAKEHQIDLKIKELKTPQEAQNAPSGFGTFSLIKDGKILADHYISKTRFETICKKEK